LKATNKFCVCMDKALHKTGIKKLVLDAFALPQKRPARIWSPKSPLTAWTVRPSFESVPRASVSLPATFGKPFGLGVALPRSFLRYLGHELLALILTVQGLGAFMLITIGVMFSRLGSSRRVLQPLVLAQIIRAGLNLLPMAAFLAVALGLAVIGQTVSLLSQWGANQYLGKVMVTAVVRELGPLVTVLLVLLRVGAANVIELGTARALGEVEALEALGIDPIHYLVVPRVVGMALGVFALTVYLLIGALLSGYVWAFIQEVPLTPGQYLSQLAGALRGLDFLLLAVKTACFGGVIATVTCYHGLAQPLRLEEVSGATIRALAQCLILCVLVDAFFILIYLLA
jgi:phospholipid/cholesterol/gamma-HCH transport system permease protein